MFAVVVFIACFFFFCINATVCCIFFLLSDLCAALGTEPYTCTLLVFFFFFLPPARMFTSYKALSLPPLLPLLALSRSLFTLSDLYLGRLRLHHPVLHLASLMWQCKDVLSSVLRGGWVEGGKRGINSSEKSSCKRASTNKSTSQEALSPPFHFNLKANSKNGH